MKKISSLVTRAKNIEAWEKRGTFSDGKIRYLKSQLGDDVYEAKRTLGEHRFNFELKFGMEHGFRPGH
jgi:hypothetical protein